MTVHGHRPRAGEDQPAPRRRRAARGRLPPAGHRLPGRRAVRRPHRRADAAAGRLGVTVADYDRRRRRAARRRQHRRPRRARCWPTHHGLEPRGRGRASPRRSRSPAGMAGGSADAAAALVALDRLWDAAAPPTTTCSRWPRELGSDVPFALRRRHRARHRPRRGGRRRSPTPAPGGGCVVPVGRGAVDAGGLPPLRRAVPRRPGRPPRARRRAARRARRRRPAGARRGAAQRPRRPPPSTCAPTSATLIERGEAAGALRGLVSGSGPTCVFLCESADARPRGRRPAARRATHDVVLVANGPVAGAHVVTYA